MMKYLIMILSIFFMTVSSRILLMFFYNVLFIISYMYMYSYFDSMGSVCSSLSMGYYGTDIYSYYMNLLSLWILGLMFMSLRSNSDYGLSMNKIWVFLSLLLLLMGAFSSMGMLMFYFFFEVSLIPTFFLVIYWGTNPERLSAGMYLMMYTLFISLPLLIYLFWFYRENMSFNFLLMNLKFSMVMFNILDFIIIFGAFYVKLPMFLFHIWLPKAHVEAPVYGSMILAALLLKLGGYGLIRFMLTFLLLSHIYNFLILSLSLVGSVIISMMCLVQIDLKKLVAYSSVVHMNFMLSCMCTLNKMGFMGAFIMMIGHGLCSSSLFYMVNIFYLKSGSRVIFLNKGMMSNLPSYSLWWFLLCCSNFSFPLSINFFSEIYLISSLINWSTMLIIYVFIISFFCAAYSLYLYAYIFHGSQWIEDKVSTESIKEFIVLMLHYYPLMMILLNMSVLIPLN